MHDTVTIAFYSTKVWGAPMHIVDAHGSDILDLARTLATLGADYIALYTNPNCSDPHHWSYTT